MTLVDLQIASMNLSQMHNQTIQTTNNNFKKRCKSLFSAVNCKEIFDLNVKSLSLM